MFKRNFSGHTKIGGHCTRIPRRGYGPARLDETLMVDRMSVKLKCNSKLTIVLRQGALIELPVSPCHVTVVTAEHAIHLSTFYCILPVCKV